MNLLPVIVNGWWISFERNYPEPKSNREVIAYVSMYKYYDTSSDSSAVFKSRAEAIRWYKKNLIPIKKLKHTG